MAIYHFSVQVLGRAAGRRGQDGSVRKRGDSAVAAAAYRAGEALVDERANKVRDYSNRAGVVDREIILPEGAPLWLADRSKLWNEVERLEKRHDAQLAREINIALPHELNDTERFNLVSQFVREQFVSQGMVADIAWHAPPEQGDRRNHHAHIMLTLRRATPKGLHPVKTREWNARENIGAWRTAWQAHANGALQRGGHKVQLDHRTLKAQQTEATARGDSQQARLLAREPEIHIGTRAKATLRQGKQPASTAREVGAFRYQDSSKATTTRRTRDYPSRDKGTRINWLSDILLGNNQNAKADIARYNAKAARFDRWLDHWDRKASWWIEQTFSTSQQRYDRWQTTQKRKIVKAEAERKAEHARKRADQMRKLTKELRALVALLGGRQETGLHRARQVEGLGQALGRQAVRDMSGRQGQGRSPSSGHSGNASASGGDNSRGWQK